MTTNNSALPGPNDIVREVLPNGITVLTRSNFNSPSVVIGGFFGAGSLFDPDAKLGLADFVASALMRGTKTRTFDTIYNELESAGRVWGSVRACINPALTGARLRRICRSC